jgi:hypothetical protein
VRKIVYHIQMTLNNRIANADGDFWEPFPWGEEETAFLNDQFRQADTWVLRPVSEGTRSGFTGGDSVAQRTAGLVSGRLVVRMTCS